MVTALDKELKRQVTVDGLDYTVALDANGFRVTGKGKRKPQVELRWIDLLSGDAAMAVALNASLTRQQRMATETIGATAPVHSSKRPPAKSRR